MSIVRGCAPVPTWVSVPHPLWVNLIHTGPEPVPQALALAVLHPVLSAAVPHHHSRAPLVLPPLGDLLLPLALPDLSDAADSVPSASTAAAALVPPAVRSFGCVAVVARVKIIVQICC